MQQNRETLESPPGRCDVTQSSAWRRGLLEAVFILTSILLAFWIDAWWDDHQAARLESEMLVSVQAEVEQNLRQLANTKDVLSRYQDGVDQFLRSTPADLRALPQDSIRSWLVALTVPATFSPSLSAASVLVTVPVAQARESVEARRLVSSWLGRLDNLDRRSEQVSRVSAALFQHLTHYAVGGAREGLERIDPMVARLSPDVLAELRGDDIFVAAVIEIAHRRFVYLTGLEQLDETLESLSEVLGA